MEKGAAHTHTNTERMRNRGGGGGGDLRRLRERIAESEIKRAGNVQYAFNLVPCWFFCSQAAEFG